MNTPAAIRVEPALAKPDYLSDLIALACNSRGDGLGDSLHIGLEPPIHDEDTHAGAAMPMPADADADTSDPLAALTREYRRALLNRKSGNPHELKTTAADESSPAIRARRDPFAELADSSQGESSVFDLLTHGKNIDTLLGDLDSFGAGQIFESEEPHEILTLLAPHGIPARRASQAAPLAREEHHMVSVDSHMSMPDSIEYEEPESVDENDR